MNCIVNIKSVAPRVETWNFPSNHLTSKTQGYKELPGARYEKVGLSKILVVESDVSKSPNSYANSRAKAAEERKLAAIEQRKYEDWLKRQSIWRKVQDDKWEADQAIWLQEQVEIEAARKAKWEARQVRSAGKQKKKGGRRGTKHI